MLPEEGTTSSFMSSCVAHGPKDGLSHRLSRAQRKKLINALAEGVFRVQSEGPCSEKPVEQQQPRVATATLLLEGADNHAGEKLPTSTKDSKKTGFIMDLHSSSPSPQSEHEQCPSEKPVEQPRPAMDNHLSFREADGQSFVRA